MGPGASTVELLTAAGVLVTAAAALFGVGLAVRAFWHDRQRAGIGRFVIAPRLRESWIPPGPEYFPHAPKDWDREHIRWVPVRLHNLADYDTVAFALPDKARVGLFVRRRVDIWAGDMVTLPARLPKSYVVLVHRKSGWHRDRPFFRLAWETNTEPIRIRRRLHIKGIPDAKFWAERQPQEQKQQDVPTDSSL
jgi:hypothetical protein